MDDAVKRFLSVINFDKEDYSFFNDSKVKKVIVDENKKEWIVHLNLKKLIPIGIFKKLYENSKHIKNIKKVHFVFTFKDDCGFLIDYYKYYFDILTISCPMLESMRENNIKINGDEITIETHNPSEEKKIKSLKKNIKEFLKDMGFKNIEIVTLINEEARKEVKELISLVEKEEREESTTKSKLIYGGPIKGEVTKISNIFSEEENIVIDAYVFGIDFKNIQNKFTLVTLKISDNTDSIYAKIFAKDMVVIKNLKDNIKVGKWYKLNGYIANDNYTHDLILNIKSIEFFDVENIIRTDNAPQKRVELHAHTLMSQMDGLIDPKKLIKRVSDFGHRGVGITDKNCVQTFLKVYKAAGDLKILYGAEIYLVNDEVEIITKESDSSLKDTTFVVFDFETTGFNAGGGDSIIEIGAVKIRDGEIIDKYNELVNPGHELRSAIVNITGITDELLKGKACEEEAFKRFKDWYGDSPMVAQNARFDVSFIQSAHRKYNLGEFNNTVIDTMEISRVINPDSRSHSLSALVKRYEVEFEEGSHHRADYDALATAKVFDKMLNSLGSNYKTISDLNNLVDKEEIYKTNRPYHISVYAKNKKGLKSLYNIISLANTKYYFKGPRIPKSVLIEHRKNLIIGSGCVNGEVFNSSKTSGEDHLLNIMTFYDFIEVNPPSIQTFLVESGDFANEAELISNLNKIINAAEKIKKPVVATGDVHTLDPEDNIYREILVTQKQPQGGFHQLYRQNIKTIPNSFLMTTDEMLAEFKFLDDEKAFEIVITNSNKILDMAEDIEICDPNLYTPKMENSAEILKEMVYKNAKEIYGEKLPLIIEETLEKELSGIIKGGYDVIYLISQKLVEKSVKDGYLVGSRGSVGSSLVATFCKITEVNPLPAHYICPKCKKSLFDENGKMFFDDYASGFDLPDKKCDCGEMFIKQGQNIPFSSFLGYNAEKIPDIDLNFSSEYQSRAHEYTKELFGEKYVFRAGTVSTIADKTAFGYVKGYMEDKNIVLKKAEIERLAIGITGVKRTTGQHPGGIVVIPNYKDVTDFTPYQYPAEKMDAQWFTTHFEYHDIEDNVLKLDILGHDDPTMLKYLLDELNMTVDEIPMTDEKVLSLFSSPKALKVTAKDIMCSVGTLGVPEFGTNFVIKMLEEVKPQTFSELLKVSGLSHGTGVWAGNVKELVLEKGKSLKEVIGCREDLIADLTSFGVDGFDAFQITEFARKNLFDKNQINQPEKWKKFVEIMKENNVPAWYIDSIRKIQYLFPKAHASAYVIMAVRVAWFKVYHPINYYRVFLSVRKADFDVEVMARGENAIRAKIIEIIDKGFEASNKEQSLLDSLKSSLEMVKRGYRFENLSLIESQATMFKITEDGKGLIPPFISLDGLGEIAAQAIESERDKKPFSSIEDLQIRGKLSSTLIEKLRVMGVLEGLPESSQLSLF